MGGLEIYLRVCSSFSLIGLVIGAASFFYTLNFVGWKNVKLSIGNPLNSNSCLINQKFFIIISHFFFGVCNLIFCAYEVFLIINPVRFGYGTNGYFRGLYYCLSGFAVLGVAADLGVASGALCLVGSILTIINTSLIKCDCIRPQDTKSQHRKIEDNDEIL